MARQAIVNATRNQPETSPSDGAQNPWFYVVVSFIIDFSGTVYVGGLLSRDKETRPLDGMQFIRMGSCTP